MEEAPRFLGPPTHRALDVRVYDPDPDELSGSGVLVLEDDQAKLEPVIARLEDD